MESLACSLALSEILSYTLVTIFINVILKIRHTTWRRRLCGWCYLFSVSKLSLFSFHFAAELVFRVSLSLSVFHVKNRHVFSGDLEILLSPRLIELPNNPENFVRIEESCKAYA